MGNIYAFIDVQNTDSTTKQILNFEIDWVKLFHYLKNRWDCHSIFFYSGMEIGDVYKEKEFINLKELGYILRIKPYKTYKTLENKIHILCPNCKKVVTYHKSGKLKRKSNCDTELSVDAINLSSHGSIFMIFSGDGDFEYLIRDAVIKGVRVYIISSGKKTKIANGYSTSRFSTKLRELIKELSGQVFFIDIDTWKYKISKDL
jgi:uncharacterized LabA/DUF88 family protein